ncbi:hypothetical protein TNCV_2441751 [Trichonephila clavipes]|nr:hypothetical protein TNCV_2441751 [Trichonephila clavipes]
MCLSEGRFDLSTFRSERMNEASTLTITPKRSSWWDVGTSSYRYHTATYPPASVSANRRTNDTIFVASMPSREREVADNLTKAVTSNPVDPDATTWSLHRATEIYSRAK